MNCVRKIEELKLVCVEGRGENGFLHLHTLMLILFLMQMDKYQEKLKLICNAKLCCLFHPVASI